MKADYSYHLIKHPSLLMINNCFNLTTSEQYLDFLARKEYSNFSNTFFFYEKFIALFEAANELNKIDWLDEKVVSADFDWDEALIIIKEVFEENDLGFYKIALHKWFEESLNTQYLSDGIKTSFPVYLMAKKIIQAGKFINEQLLANQNLKYAPKLNQFSDTCPLLLTDSYFENPYLAIEYFFNGATLLEYKTDIREWFKAALTKKLKCKSSSALLYFHNQIINLLQAGYLITEYNLPYQQSVKGTDSTFKDWISRLRKQEIAKGINDAYSVNLLEDRYKKDPLLFLKQSLTLTKIKDLRYNLQEWLHFALTENDSIDEQFPFEQYEQLEKLVEAFFLVVTE